MIREKLVELGRGSFVPLALIYAALFGAFGTESPFFPAFLKSRGLGAVEIGIVLSAGTVVRLVVGPLVGFVADRFGARSTLAAAALGAGAFDLCYLAGSGFAMLTTVAALHAAAVSALNPLADALALPASEREKTFDYGWVRGIGSAVFVIATSLSGLTVGFFGLGSIIIVSSVLFAAMAAPVAAMAPAPPAEVESRAIDAGLVAVTTGLVRIPLFRRALIFAGLVIGSQAMSDTFAVIHWRSAGTSSAVIGALWSEAVASEVVVFLILGPFMLRRLGPRSCALAAAAGGIVQWAALAMTSQPLVLILTQPLQGLTFALTHLITQHVIGTAVPPQHVATAQVLYGTIVLGLASVALTLGSSALYASFGAPSFFFMSALCAAALPCALRMQPSRGAGELRSERWA